MPLLNVASLDLCVKDFQLKDVSKVRVEYQIMCCIIFAIVFGLAEKNLLKKINKIKNHSLTFKCSCLQFDVFLKNNFITSLSIIIQVSRQWKNDC